MRPRLPSPSRSSFDPYGLAGVLACALSAWVVLTLLTALAWADTHYDTLERRNPAGVSEPVAGAKILVRNSGDCSSIATPVTDEDGNWSFDLPVAGADYDLLFYVCAAGSR